MTEEKVADSIKKVGFTVEEAIYAAFITPSDENPAVNTNITDALIKIENALQGSQHSNTIADALFDIAKAINKLAGNIEKVGDIGSSIERLAECIDNKKSPAEIKEKQMKKHYEEISECYKKGQCECGAKLDNGNRIIDLGYETGYQCNRCC